MKTFSKSPSAKEAIRAVPCPLCGGDRLKPRWTVEGVPFVTCGDCGLVHQNPRPESVSLAERYDAEYFDYEIRNEDSFFTLMMLGLDDASFFDRVVPTLPDERRVLDVGCATGRLLGHFKALGWDTAGVELCRESVEYGNRKYHAGIRNCALHQAAFPANHFAVVHASHLIEHVDDPAAFLREVVKILMPGGVFVCVTPCIDGFQARLYGPQWRSAIADHVTLFGKPTLRRLLEQAGLRVEQVSTWGGLAAGTAPRWIKKPMDRLAKIWGFGDVVLMLARKPDGG